MLNLDPNPNWLNTRLYNQGRKKGRQEGRQEESKLILMRQLQCRFGELPTWVNEKLAKAELPSLEEWGLRFVNAQSLEAVFSDRT